MATTMTTAEADKVLKAIAKEHRTGKALVRIHSESLGAFMYRKTVVRDGAAVFSLIGATCPGRGRGVKLWSIPTAADDLSIAKLADFRAAGFSERCAPGTEFVVSADRTLEVK